MVYQRDILRRAAALLAADDEASTRGCAQAKGFSSRVKHINASGKALLIENSNQGFGNPDRGKACQVPPRHYWHASRFRTPLAHSPPLPLARHSPACPRPPRATRALIAYCLVLSSSGSAVLRILQGRRSLLLASLLPDRCDMTSAVN